MVVYFQIVHLGSNGSLYLPPPSPLPGNAAPQLPFTNVGDAAFPLRNYLLCPYPGRDLPDILLYL